MVRHMDNIFGGSIDSGALAEGVWEYVNDLVKSYHSREPNQCQVIIILIIIVVN